ncbi:hypothetical protein J4408_01705 [Candidatus Pacearchaeota archaeon]|nr:hypothetical protein [Candidatus Pacearchaeota archaeon]
MDSFLKKITEKKQDFESKRYLIRFGKGDYKRRFLISFSKGSKIKIRGSFEWANDFVKFIRENKEITFSGKVLSKDKIAGLDGRKKGGVFAYEVINSNLKEFENPYFYLVDANDSEIVLKVKKSLPKPGKNEEKIDDKFCSLDLDLKYWPKVKEFLFWDTPDCKEAKIEHELIITDIEMPKELNDPAKIRELAVRKGKMLRKITADKKESVKEYVLEI